MTFSKSFWRQQCSIIRHKNTLQHPEAWVYHPNRFGTHAEHASLPQLIRSAGAHPIATAGGPSKRALLRSLGVPVVLSSRDTTFEEDVAVATGGKGVAAALNSLTSPGMVAASLASLGQGARFVEIGKRDIWSQRRFAMVSASLSFPNTPCVWWETVTRYPFPHQTDADWLSVANIEGCFHKSIKGLLDKLGQTTSLSDVKKERVKESRQY